MSLAIAYTDTDDLEKEQEKREAVYGSFEFFEEELNPNRLRVQKIEGGDPVTLVSRDDLHVGGFEWKPDGTALAFSASPAALLKSSIDSDIFTVDVKTKEIIQLVKQPGPDSSPVWSPDGEKIAFSTSGGKTGKILFSEYQDCCYPVRRRGNKDH